MGEKIKYKDIRKNEEINMLIDKGNCVLKTMGFRPFDKARRQGRRTSRMDT